MKFRPKHPSYLANTPEVIRKYYLLGENTRVLKSPAKGAPKQ